MSHLKPQMPTASTLFSAYASLSALSMLLRSIFNDLLPTPLRHFLLSLFYRLLHRRPSNHLTLVIEETNSAGGIGRNHLFDAAELYLTTTKLTTATSTTHRLKITKSPKDKLLTVKFHGGETLDDSFNGIPLRWRFFSDKRPVVKDNDDVSLTASATSDVRETRFFELSLEKRHKDKIMEGYIPHVISSYNSILEGRRPLKLCTLGEGGRGFRCGGAYWESVNLQHPFTFDTLAMDPDQKKAIMDDLDRFLRRKEFYRRVGRAWKRGYLLYGPPGTGKSSLIAAMANHLRFDIYDLQLGNCMKDSDLRRLLLSTSNRSILVIEDIDCSVDVNNYRCEFGPEVKRQDVQLTLSGLLNFIDGLWSSCGDQRIIIFTTNHKEKLDPALLRPGRMDMHIHMSYLTVQGFRVLASNYLGLKAPHRLTEEIEKLIETVNVTPAQVAEELMRTEDVDVALEGVAKLLKKNKEEMKPNEDVVMAKPV